MDLIVAVLLFTTIFSVVAQPAKEKFDDYCLNEAGIDRIAYYKTLYYQNVQNADMKIKCAAKCLLTQYQVMNAGGTFDMEKVAEVVFSVVPENEENIKLLKICTAAQENECDTAYHMVTCVNKIIMQQ